MKSENCYESVEEMDKCRKEAQIELEKLHKKLGFVIFEVAENIKLKGMTGIQRMKYFRSRCRGGSSY